MNVLYFTNSDIQDWQVIPDIIRATGDNVITHTSRVDLEIICANEIEFIVSDRARYLIRQDVLSHLPSKIINLHPSYLPWNRGYHPNYWSIKQGTPMGVTLHHIDIGIDTGSIISQAKVQYDEDDTLRTTYDRSRLAMIEVFAAAWPKVRLGMHDVRPQDHQSGSFHLNKDFDGILEALPNGWDTKITDI